MREVLPWHVVASRLSLPDSGVGVAARAAANDASGPHAACHAALDEEAPVSGVRTDGGHPMTDGAEHQPPLTYKVYTLADLDRRDSETPVSASLDETGENRAASAFPAAAWLAAGRSLVAELLAVTTWVRLGKGRPPFADALRAPSVVVASDVRAALRATAWKKVAVAVGGGFAIMAVLLFGVLTVADLTDDLRATSAAEMAKSPLPPEMRLRGTPASAPIELPDTPSVAPDVAPDVADLGDVADVGDVDTSPAISRSSKASKTDKRRGKSKKHARSADVEVFIP